MAEGIDRISAVDAAASWLEYHRYIPLGALAFLSILLAFPLDSSLWLDETITAWIVSGDFSDAVGRTYAHQGQSPLYFVFVWALVQLFGDSELALRLPSVLAGACTLAVLYALARRLFDGVTAGAAVVALACTDGFVKSTLNARPYGLALLFAAASVLAFVRLIESPKPGRAALYVALTILSFYLHYFFIGIVPVHILLGISVWRKDRDPRTARRAAAAIALTVLLAIPGLLHALEIAHRREIYQFAMPLPGALALGKAIMPPVLAVLLVCGMALARVDGAYRYRLPYEIPTGQLAALAFWWIFPPVLFFLYSHATDNFLLHWRFYVWHAPALALLSALVLRSIDTSRGRAIALSSMALMVVAVPRDWVIEDWRRAAEIVREQNGAPVLLSSGLVELESIDALEDPEMRGYLTTPLGYYGARVDFLLPSSFESEAARRYLEGRVGPGVRRADRLVLVSQRMRQYGGPAILPDYYLEIAARSGFSAKPLLEKGSVKVYLLERE